MPPCTLQSTPPTKKKHGNLFFAIGPKQMPLPKKHIATHITSPNISGT